MQLPYLDPSNSTMHLADHPFYRTQHIIVYYVTFLLILFVIVTATCIFIEFLAAFTKKCIDIMAHHLTSDFATISNPQPRHTDPQMLKHQLLDQTCPLTTPALNHLSEQQHIQSPPSRKPCSICAICCNPLTMGDLTRNFPCNHRFHARCVDRACIIDNNSEKPVRLPAAYLQCPVCSHVIFPTPDLITNCIISIE